MAAKVVSIEIGYSLTRISEVDYKTKNPKVYSCFTVPTPQGGLDDGVLNVTDSMINFIRKGLRENGVRAKNAVFTITSTKIANREVTIPMVKENKIGDIVAANLSEYFPVDLTQYHIAHNVISTVTNEKNEKFYRVNVLATPNRVIDGYKQLAKACNLNVVAIDYIGNSLYNMVGEECASGNSLVVKIDEKAAIVTAIQSGVTVLQRSVPYGVDEVISSASQANQYNSKMTYEQLVDVLCQQRFIQNSFSDGDKITESLRALVGGVARVIDYYNSKHGMQPIERLVLTGLGAKFIGVSELFARELGFETEVLNDVKRVHSGKALRNKNLGTYIGVIGAAIRPLNFVPAVKGLETEKAKGGNSALPAILFVISIVASLAMAALSYLPYLQELETKDELERQIEALKEIENTYAEYLKEEATNKYLKELDALSFNYNNEIVAFIEQLEDNVPKNFRLDSFSASGGNVNISFTVENKKEAANLLVTLRSFENLKNVQATSLNEVSDDGGLTYVINMSVSAQFTTPAPEPTEEESTETEE